MSFHPRDVHSFFLFTVKDQKDVTSCQAVQDKFRMFERDLEAKEILYSVDNAWPSNEKGMVFISGFTNHCCESSTTESDGVVIQLVDIPEADKFTPPIDRFVVDKVYGGGDCSPRASVLDPETGMHYISEGRNSEHAKHLAKIALRARVTASEQIRIVGDKAPPVPPSVEDVEKLNAIRAIVNGWDNCPEEIKRAVAFRAQDGIRGLIHREKVMV